MKNALCLLLLLASPAFCAEPWKLVWSDEFNTNGPPNPANWTYERGFVRNEERQWYQPENAVCTNGLLVIEARSEHRHNPQYVAGSKNWIWVRVLQPGFACLAASGGQVERAEPVRSSQHSAVTCNVLRASHQLVRIPRRFRIPR